MMIPCWVVLFSSMMISKRFFFLLLLAHLQPEALVKGDGTLIKKTCKNTDYFDLCFSSLKSDPSSTNADPKGLAVIMVGIGMANATSTSLYLSSQTQLLGTANDSIKRVLKECAEKYTYANDALQASAQDLANEAYDYASMHIAAASDYPSVCHNMYKRYQGLVYPPELARREDGLKRICDVAMRIVQNLDW
ncbi:hypothetical protein V8G54_001179 [Vigna mungo]|uniref:Pectinesterase inhibitor domain-containing protein n=1 Tax=Vigna mungo TaxID=3915 RepID=A0AAQ3P6N7_VIGMU